MASSRAGLCVDLNWDPPDSVGKFSYQTSGVHDDSGYVIYGPDGKRIESWDLVEDLNKLLLCDEDQDDPVILVKVEVICPAL